MNEKKIKLMATEEVQEFVKAAGDCDFDIDILYQRMIVDAKSLLGVLSLGLAKELIVKYWGENSAFENVIQKYAAMQLTENVENTEDRKRRQVKKEGPASFSLVLTGWSEAGAGSHCGLMR